MQQLVAILLVILWVALATYGDVQFKSNPKIISVEFGLGLAAYSACSFVAIATFRMQSWGWIFIAWNCLSLALGLILAVAMFHEPMTWRRIAASVLLITAMMLAE